MFSAAEESSSPKARSGVAQPASQASAMSQEAEPSLKKIRFCGRDLPATTSTSAEDIQRTSVVLTPAFRVAPGSRATGSTDHPAAEVEAGAIPWWTSGPGLEAPAEAVFEDCQKLKSCVRGDGRTRMERAYKWGREANNYLNGRCSRLLDRCNYWREKFFVILRSDLTTVPSYTTSTESRSTFLDSTDSVVFGFPSKLEAVAFIRGAGFNGEIQRSEALLSRDVH